MDEQTEEICSELGRLPDWASRKGALQHLPQLINPEVVTQLAEAVRVAVRVDVRKALALAEAALTIAGELKTSEALAFGTRAKANALWFMGDCKSATELFHHAAALFEQAGNFNEVARTLSGSIQSLALLGEYEEAFAAAERAREIFTSLDDSLRLARLDINVANIYHRQNRYAEALTVYERAYHQLLPHRDMEGIGGALHNMAVCLIALDDFVCALETYRRVREFFERHDMPLLVAQADYNIAFLYYLRGDYTKALELLRSTREAFQQSGDTYHLGLCDLDKSEIYLELRLVGEAAEMAQNSLEHFERLSMGFESARAFTNLAIAVSLQSDWDRALQLFAKANEIARAENNHVWPNITDLYRALVLFEQGELSGASDLALSAADFFRQAHMPSKQVLCLLLLARIGLRLGAIDDAGRYCEEVSKVLESLDAPMLTYQAEFLWGKVYEALGDIERAYNCYQKSRSALETLRSSLQREELKLGFMRNRLEVYSRLIQICLDRHSAELSDGASPSSQASALEEALHYVEAARSRTLRDLILGGTQSGLRGSEENETDRHVRELRKELNWFYHRIEREQLSQGAVSLRDIESLTNQAKKREHELLRLLLESADSPSLGAALQNSGTATLEQIRRSLPPEAALLEYFAIGDRTFAAVVTASTLKIVPLALSSVIAKQLRLFQFQISKFRLNAEYISRFHQILVRTAQVHLQALYDAVVGPLEGLLHVRDLVIVPFGPLHSLPFHALFDGQRYLVDRFSMCYAPSASIFAHSDGKSANCSGPSLILGVDDPRTPFINEEVRAVASVVPEPRVLCGAEATEQALREHGPSSRLIHVASHGSFRQDSPMFSSIKLADSYLTLYDLYHMNLPVDLLTLSGCVTGLNVVEEGDELLGLTRGLLYSGARSLLLSLWEVDDRSTSELMRDFYSGLKRHPRKADALRAAMLELRERCPHPYYWAPFKLLGKALA
ncbi:MAG: CHAT domain-containing tetratricopeptide repeat protein [Acidobacteriota bacterium]|nr:CHAT domain-containing tetratricopeptide repeat protein [Acidobacteriota bacterium]